MSTSRVGRKPVTIPKGVEIIVAGQQITVKGPKGQLSEPLHSNIHVNVDDGQVTIQSNAKGGYVRSGSGSRLVRSIVGTTRAKIFNMVTGVTAGFERKLALVGVGYRAQAKGKQLSLTIGYSHPVDFNIPDGIVIETPTQTEIIIKGLDKHKVGQVAATIRRFRQPEPYKGKGIKYANETIIRKETKKK